MILNFVAVLGEILLVREIEVVVLARSVEWSYIYLGHGVENFHVGVGDLTLARWGHVLLAIIVFFPFVNITWLFLVALSHPLITHLIH